MPIFETNGIKYNVQDEHIEKFAGKFPGATTIMERDGKKYRVKVEDYNTFQRDTLQPKQERATTATPQQDDSFEGKLKTSGINPNSEAGLIFGEIKGKFDGLSKDPIGGIKTLFGKIADKTGRPEEGQPAKAEEQQADEPLINKVPGPIGDRLRARVAQDNFDNLGLREQMELVDAPGRYVLDFEQGEPDMSEEYRKGLKEAFVNRTGGRSVNEAGEGVDPMDVRRFEGYSERELLAGIGSQKAKNAYLDYRVDKNIADITDGLVKDFNAERYTRQKKVDDTMKAYMSTVGYNPENYFIYRKHAVESVGADDLAMIKEFAKKASDVIMTDNGRKREAEKMAETLGMSLEGYLNNIVMPEMERTLYEKWIGPQAKKAKREYGMFNAMAGNSLVGLLNSINMTDTDKYLLQEGDKAWRQDASMLERAGAAAGGMLLDLPAFGLTGSVASIPAKAVGKAAVKGLVKREAAKAMAKGATAEAAKRYGNYAVQNSLKNRILLSLSTAPLQSGLTFGMFDAGKAALNMSLNGEWDWKELGKSALGGTLLGGALGATGAVGGGLTHGLTGATKAAAKVAEFGVENAVFTEGGRLIGKLHGQEPENGWLEDYVESGATLLMIKAPNIAKNVSRIKGDKEASEVFAFNKLEREQLGKYGKDLNAVLESLLPQSAKLYEDGLKIDEGTFTQEYRRVMADPEIPMTAKAKLMGIVEGKAMMPPRVTDAVLEGNRVMTYDPMGRLVEVKEYATEAKADAEYKKLADKAEIESIGMLEDMYVRLKGYQADDATVREWFAKNPDVKTEEVAAIIAKDNVGEPLTKAEQKILDSLRKARREGLNDVVHLNEVLAGLEQKGIKAKDVIAGIEKPASERTEAENKAVNAYREVLMNEVEYIFKAKKLVTEAEMREQRIRTAEDVERAAESVRRPQEGVKMLADRIQESDRQIDETANNGLVYTTTNHEGEKIIITSGKVVLDNEGYIDVNQSEGLVDLMPDGTKKPVKPGELRDKFEVANAEELKAAKRAEIEAEAESEVSQGGELVPGAEIEIAFDGKVFKLKVEGRDERGDIILSGEGESMAIPESAVQEGMKEAEALQAEIGKVETENQIEVAPVESTVPTAEEVVDAQAFADAYAVNTVEAYQNYLDNHPEGAYRDGARNGIWALEGTSSVADIGSITNAENVLKRAAANKVQPEVTPVVEGQKGENAEKVVESSPTGEAATPVVEAPKTALEQIPRNEKNVPLYEQVDSELAWDGVVEEAGGNEETAMIAVNSMVADKQDALKKAEKAKAKGGATITEKIAAENERVANIEKAKADLAKWEEIAGVKAKRALAAEAESKRVADEAAARLRAEEERLRAEREETERAEREALNGVPDMVDDKPQDARARGYRRVNGHKVDRQEPVQGLMGKEIAVKFSDSSIPTGRVAVIEAEQLQPSHIQGQRNPLHFIDEAQPKERNDAASVLSARKIAENVRPEEITSSVTAYTGAPTVNARGEAVQGNNRSAALRLMWENNPEQAAKYKQYLMDHATEFGLNAEDVAAMKSPVLVNMLDVSDADAITLGQYVAQDTESGGTERIKPKNVMQKMGGDMRTFAAKLLTTANEDASFAELVDANGVDVLKWMAQKGYITPTQYKSAFDTKGNLTAEVKNDLRDVMYQSIFKGGSTLLEEMFNALPTKAQKAILATAFRDYDSPSAERMNGEVQNSIRAYYALARDAAFANAKNYKEAKEAAMMWARQYQLDDVSGESFLPSENFSNFAIELAIVYKGWTQRNLQNHFNNIYDLVQGTKEASLFEEADNTPRTLKEAIKETFNIDYNGQSNSNSLAIDSKDGQARKRGGNGDIATGERIEGGERPADSTGGARGNGEVSSSEIPNNQNRGNVSQVEGAVEGGNTPGQSGVAVPKVGKMLSLGEEALVRSEQKQEEKRRVPLRNRAQEWTEKLGVPMKVHESVETVTNKEARRRLGNGEPLEGWFNVTTGDVEIYLPNVEDTAQVDRVYLHEVVGHKGLREVMGEKFDALCDSAWDVMDAKARKHFLEYVGAVDENGNVLENPSLRQMREAADEYMAWMTKNVDYETNKELWQPLIDSVREFFESLGMGVAEGEKGASPFVMSDADIVNLIKASYANLASKASVSSVTEAAEMADDAPIMASVATERELQERIKAYAESKEGKKAGWTPEMVEGITKETEALIGAIDAAMRGNEFYDAFADRQPTIRTDWRDGVAKPTVTWTRGNVEYKYDMSADLLCINNDGIEEVLSSPRMVELMASLPTKSVDGYELSMTGDDYMTLYGIMREMGFVVPCKGCFDAAARFKMLPSVAQKFAADVNRVVDERNADPEAFDAKVKAMAGKETTVEGLPVSAKNKELAIMVGVAGDKLTEHISWTQLMSAEGQTKMLADLSGVFRAWERTGAGRPKDKLQAEPYYGDIVSQMTTIIGKHGEKTPAFRDIQVNTGTGLRRNSHSEFRPVLAVDEIQFMRDAFIKGLTVFKYMKELDDVRLFGQMGVKYNMSFFPEHVKGAKVSGLDADGNYIASEESVGAREFPYTVDGKKHYDGMKGWEEAQKMVNENVSLSSVVFSVPHLIKAMTDVPTVSDKSGLWGSLIPFHSSGATTGQLAAQGLGAARAYGVGHSFEEAMYDYGKGVTNFEQVQNDRFGEGWVIVSGKKAGEAVKPGHKLEFVNGNHYYNEALGVHLFPGGYALDAEVPARKRRELDNARTRGKYVHPFSVDYNEKVREIGTPTAYKEAADYYLEMLPKLGLVPRFQFEVDEATFLKMCEDAKVDPKHPKLGWKGGNWSPTDAESYYSLFCDYGMTDPKTGDWSPHRPVGFIDENGERVFRLPDNAVEIAKNGLDRFSEVRRRENARVDEVIDRFEDAMREQGRLPEVDAERDGEVRFSKVSREIESLFDQAVAGDLTGKPVPVGKLTKDGKAYLESISGLTIKDDVNFVLNPSDLLHIYKNHYEENEKDKGNNIPLNKHDIRRMVDVIAFPTTVVYGESENGRKSFYFLMDTPSGAYNLLEIYADKKGNLSSKTYYKTKKGVSQRVMNIFNSLHSTSATDGATLSNAKVPQMFENTKSLEENSAADVNPQDSESGIRFSKVTDPAKIAELEAGETIPTYRAMVLIDGKLYPPMSSKEDGVLREPSEFGVWEQAEENPGKAKEKNGKYYFTLNKDNGKSVRDVAYNPYLHSSTTMLNDQFKEAQSRPNLVVVEMAIPKSELTSGYKADKAHDAVGTKDWKAGTIQGQLTGTRKVVLSRWGKPVRIVPVEEVAENIKGLIDGQVEYMPTNVVTPAQRKALEDIGVKFVETDNSEIIQEGEHKGEQYSSVYGKKAKKIKKSDTRFRKVTPEMDAEYMTAVENGDMESAERLVTEAAKMAMPDTKVVDEDGYPMVVYHGTTEDFNVFDKTKGRANMDIQGMFFSPWDLDAKGYGPNVRAFFLDVKNPANESVGYEAFKKFQGQNGAGVKAREYLVSLGYDGVNNEDQEFVAFEPNQIKSADAVTYDDNGNVIPLGERFNEEKDDIRFSMAVEVAPERDIPLDEVKSQPLTSFKDLVTNKVLETSAKNKENLALRSDALRMYGRDVANVLKLMGKQREYDKSTVDQLVKLAKMYFKDAQLLGGLTPYQVGRVMTRLNSAVGKRDITDDANELVNILVDAHNKELDRMLDKAAKTKAKKVNASGVEVIGKLDKEGQLLLEEYNNSKVLDLETIDEKILDLQNEAAEASGKLEGENGEVEREVAAKIRGLELARQYREEILAKQTEIKGLEQELKSAEQDAKDGAMDRAAYKEFRRATERAILESKLEMVDAYHGLIHGLGGDISSSAKRAKLFQQAQIDHVKEIQHNANSDLLGHPANAQGDTPDKWNSAVPRFFMVAMPTFQRMLKFFGEKAPDGRGYLYERFIPQHTQASHNEYMGKAEAREKMRNKLTEIFGKKTSIEDFMDMSRKDGAVLEYQEGGEKKTIDLTKGQVLYLYMINKMADGQMKLSKMGITDADVQKMAGELPEEMLRFADWVQEELLTELREKYNKVHERMFGAPMAAIESYFPIKINKRSRGEKIEPGMNAEDKPSTVTGSVIKRTKNSIAVDLSADAMQVLLGHIDEMENWAAWAEFRRDLKSLLNYRHFQNQVKGMESLRFGSGEKLWKNFVDVANIAAGSYKPSDSGADKVAMKIAKGFVSSKIAFRYFTAVKQILSTPAFWSEADFDKMIHAYLHQKEAWDWAMKELPGFSKRWEGRASGNEILLESEKDWETWRNRMVDKLSKEGMRANAFIDALTVATGAKAVFETKYEMFKKAGYSEERAKEKALQRAAEAYNESQQSSESAYLSPLQANRTWLTALLAAYRNSPFGYNGKAFDAVAGLKKMSEKGYKRESIDFLVKQMMRDGLNEEQAKRFAESVYKRSKARHAANIALYLFFLNYIWELGPDLIYILGGDDDEKKKELNVEALIDGAMGGLGNLPAGDALVGAIKAMATQDASKFQLPKAVATQDIENLADVMQMDFVRGVNELLNAVVAARWGFNPQTFTDMFVAFSDVEGFNAEELGMLIMRIASSPNSKLELLEADEAMENYGANMEEVMREYAEYQKSKRAPLTGWLYSDESEQKAIERYEKRFEKLLDERFETIVENTGEYDAFYENADPLMKSKLAKLRKAYLDGDKKVTFEKLEAEDLVKKTLYGAGYDDINTVYYELSNAQDEDMELMIDKKFKELTPLYEAYKKEWMAADQSEQKGIYEKNEKMVGLYNNLKQVINGVNSQKNFMKKNPEQAQEYMNNIRGLRTKAIDLINDYNE